MEQLVQSFIDQMNSRMGEDFNQLGTALKEMVEANKAFQYTMGELLNLSSPHLVIQEMLQHRCKKLSPVQQQQWQT